MTVKQLLKKNRLLVFVALTYGILFIFTPDKASKAIGNSVYYLIEMFQVLPVIFLLTVVIEALVPKELIIKHFGEKSGFFGKMSVYFLKVVELILHSFSPVLNVAHFFPINISQFLVMRYLQLEDR